MVARKITELKDFKTDFPCSKDRDNKDLIRSKRD